MESMGYIISYIYILYHTLIHNGLELNFKNLFPLRVFHYGYDTWGNVNPYVLFPPNNKSSIHGSVNIPFVTWIYRWEMDPEMNI